MRSSQQRRINSTLDNYKKGGATGRITQTIVDNQNAQNTTFHGQQNLNYQMQTIQQKTPSGRAGSNIRNAPTGQLTLTKEQINAAQPPRAKSNLKDAQMNPQLNNYLQQHELKGMQTNTQQQNPNNIRQMVNQSPLYNQL